MVDYSPEAILGAWKEGFALDRHTVSSTYRGDNEFGNPVYDTVRSELGQLLYELKYRGEHSVVGPIVDAAAHFSSPGLQILT